MSGLRVGGAAGWVYGPELGIRHDFGPRWGVQLRAALPVLDSQPFADDGAAAVDLGPTLTFASGMKEFGLGAGATGLLVSDRGVLTEGGIGAFVDGHATVWLSRQLGALAGATVRIGGSGAAYPSVNAGIAVRF